MGEGQDLTVPRGILHAVEAGDIAVPVIGEVSFRLEVVGSDGGAGVVHRIRQACHTVISITIGICNRSSG